MKRIIIAHDGSRAAFRALLAATDLARKVGCRLTVLSVLPCDCFQGGSKEAGRRGRCKDLMKGVDDVLRFEGVEGETVVLPGEDPARVIIDQAGITGADLVVIGSRRRHAVRKAPWGSVSTRVAAQAPCTVFVV